MRLALVSRELHPLSGGGIGHYTAGLARTLAPVAEVTVLTTSGYDGVFELEHARRRAAGDPQLLPESVRIVFVPEPTVEEVKGWYHVMQLYSARVWDALREVYADQPPDLIEFPDYLGEGFVTVQAAQALDPFLAGTRICVRLHTSAEIVEMLNGYLRPDLPSRIVHELERGVLRGADSVLWAGGDVLETYRRFYGADALAPGHTVRHPLNGTVVPGAAPLPGAPGDGVRFLFVGRLERRKGVVELVRALQGLDRSDWSLTVVGGDTDTGPLGTSVRGTLELMASDDDRVALVGELGSGELPDVLAAHDVVVVPSRWECWPYVVLEAFSANRPVLATGVGGPAEMVQPGMSGWLARGAGPDALEPAIEAVLEQGRAGIARLVEDEGPRRRALELADEVGIRDGYATLASADLARGGARTVPRPVGSPLVSVVVPFYGMSEFVGETVASVLSQSYGRIEVVLVVDGSFGDDDWVVAELSARYPVVAVAQVNRGLGAARNFGIGQSRGRYVFPLDADNMAEPGFVERCVAVLEASPEVAYVTSWSRYMDERGVPRCHGDVGYEPLGNRATRVLAEENVAGDAAAVIRRRVFDSGLWYSEELTSYEDWAFYRRLAAAGHYGVVIPERLLRYRVRSDSMQAQTAQPNRARLLGEIEAHIQENAIRWTP